VTKASKTAQNPRPDLAERAGYLIEVAARAPSVHNTQPWRFTVTEQAVELYADSGRQLLEDPAGREMIISCGAALFGLRLAIRSLGYQPEADLFPEPGQRHLLARVRAGRPLPVTADERAMLRAVPHRHTHRGAFEPGPLPGDLLARLHDDAAAEGATLVIVDGGPAYQRLTAILAAWRRRQDLYPTSPAEIQARAETRRWTREADSEARDGVPAHAFPAATGSETGSLPQRDFDLGRGWGLAPSGGPPRSGHGDPGDTRRGRGELAARRPGPATAAAPRRRPVGLRQPADRAAAIHAGPGADPQQPGAGGGAATAAGARRGPDQPLHQPPACRGTDHRRMTKVSAYGKR
jgi:nitroreductase